MSLVTVTTPAVEPCTIADAKLFARVDATTDNDLFTSLVTACRVACEHYTRRAFITQTLKLVFDGTPPDVIELPKPPLASVTHVKFTDSADSQGAAVSSSVYVVDTASIPGRILKKESQSWGHTALRKFMGTEIQFVAGYGATAADGATAGSVPTDIVLAIKRTILANYEDRDPIVKDGKPVELPDDVKLLLFPYRVLKI